MTEIEMKHWLNRAFYANKKQNALEQIVKQCRIQAQCTSINYESNTDKPTGAQNGVESAYLKLAEVEEKAQEQKKECVKVISEIQNAIALLHNDDLEAVLINRYLNYMSIEETAEFMNYAPRTVRMKQKQAIEKLCPLLPCFASFDVIS